MKLLKKYITPLTEGAFLLFIFFFSQLPLRDFDIWFHIKAGELFVTLGRLPFTEYFSYSAQGREWIHFEWLFQIIVYLLSTIDIAVIPPFISLFTVILFFFLLRIFGDIFKLNLLTRILLSFVFFVLTYEYYTARPHVLAYTFMVMTLFFILAWIRQGKKWLYATPFLTLIWNNVHSTGFLSWGLMLAFAVLLLAQWLIKHREKDLLKSKTLLVISAINFVITILPPMGFMDYKLLWHFFKDREFLGIFIAEWAPASADENPFGYYLFSALLLFSSISFLLINLRRKTLFKNLWGIPFIFMGLMGYTAARNIFPATLGILILLAWDIRRILDFLDSKIEEKRALHAAKTIIISLLVTILVGFFAYFLDLKQHAFAGRRLYYPVQSTEFAKQYLSGRMFNDYTYGGYILYHTYPKLQVLIDGRAEVYACCEMRDYLELAINKYLPDKQYKELLDEYWEKNDISFAIISTQKNNVMRRIARILNTDPTRWALVFWDDDSQIFVKKDGHNDKVISQLEAHYATPYLKDPFVKGKMDEALKEYERMDSVAPSAQTHNAIGYILMQKETFDQAALRFNAALEQNPTFESPYMNMAELAVREGDLDSAIGLYTQAKRYAPDRGLVYIRLGQLLQERDGNTKAVRDIWEEGVSNTVDEEAKKKLQSLLSSL